MAYAELDPLFVQGLRLLNSKSKDSAEQLRALLEEAIRQKHGDAKSLKNLVLEREPSRRNRNGDDFPSASSEGSSSSDRRAEATEEIILDDDDDDDFGLGILGDDLSCVVCNRMDVTAGNQLAECLECHNLYHQECHQPPVADDARSNWYCNSCVKPSSKVSSKTSSKFSEKEGHSSKVELPVSSSKKVIETESSVITSRSAKIVSETSSSSKSQIGSTSAQKAVTPKVNIVHADKRIQDMKKKAASKIHDKRKHAK